MASTTRSVWTAPASAALLPAAEKPARFTNELPANPVAGFLAERRIIPPLLGGEGRGEDGRLN